MYYGPVLIMENGVELPGYEDDPDKEAVILSIPLAATNAFGTLISYFILDNLGRRWILLRMAPGAFVSLLLISLSMYLAVIEGEDDPEKKRAGNILFMTSIIAYLLFFSIGFSASVWTINSEIFPIHLTGTACALTTATNWLSNFAVASVFLTAMETDWGKVITFLVLASFAAGAWFFVYFLVPETKGKRIHENVKAIVGDAE